MNDNGQETPLVAREESMEVILRRRLEQQLSQANDRIKELETEVDAAMQHWKESDDEIGEQYKTINRLCDALLEAADNLDDAKYFGLTGKYRALVTEIQGEK